jgi:hypothetical protein
VKETLTIRADVDDAKYVAQEVAQFLGGYSTGLQWVDVEAHTTSAIWSVFKEDVYARTLVGWEGYGSGDVRLVGEQIQVRAAAPGETMYVKRVIAQ